MNLKQGLFLALIAAAALVFALFTGGDNHDASDGNGHGHGHEEGEEEHVDRGPHGGRMLELGGLAVEVTIYETGVKPRFRVYPYRDGKPIAPEEVGLNAELHRLGGRVEPLTFTARDGYLVSDQTVEEPHSFEARFEARYGELQGSGAYIQEEGRVEMKAQTLEASGIVLETAGPASIRSVIEMPGEVRLNLDRTAHIGARLNGVIAEYPINLGDRVEKGQPLVVLASRELADAKQAFVESLHHMELAESTFRREERLWNKGITPEEEYLKARHALEEARINRTAARDKLLALGVARKVIDSLSLDPERNLARFELHAPFSGTVIEKNFALGESVSSDADLLVVADLSSVWIDVNISPENLRFVRAGQKVRVVSKELGTEAEGELTFVGPVSQGETRVARGRVVLPNPDDTWRPGVFVSAQVVTEEVEVPVAVRNEALQTFNDMTVVFVRYGNTFEAQPIETGRSDGRFTEVRKGLPPGVSYAADNSFVVKADILKAGATHDH